MSSRVKLHVHRVDPELKTRLNAEADSRGVSLQTHAAAVLCECFRVPFDGTGRRSTGVGASTQLVIPVPVKLKLKLDVEAARRGETLVALFDRVVREYFASADAALTAAASA